MVLFYSIQGLSSNEIISREGPLLQKLYCHCRVTIQKKFLSGFHWNVKNMPQRTNRLSAVYNYQELSWGFLSIETMSFYRTGEYWSSTCGIQSARTIVEHKYFLSSRICRMKIWHVYLRRSSNG